MRELIYKNLTSLSQKKKDITVKEVFERNGFVTRTERRVFYYIKDVSQMDSDSDFNKWLSSKAPSSNDSNYRHYHVLREHNDKIGQDKLLCKVIGTFYAVSGRFIYTVAFLHAFKVTFARRS